MKQNEVIAIKTAVTELLGIEYPVIQGGMAWIADASLAAAVSEGGGLGRKIARSLTQLQHGEFLLTVDGDLVKAEVILPQAAGDAPVLEPGD